MPPELLFRFVPCKDARTWASTLPADTTAEQAWSACVRGDWLLWLVGSVLTNHRNVDAHRRLVLAACDCAETAGGLAPEGDLAACEHALALALALARKLPERAKATSWGKKFAVSLYDSNVTIIGAGGKRIIFLDPKNAAGTLIELKASA